MPTEDAAIDAGNGINNGALALADFAANHAQKLRGNAQIGGHVFLLDATGDLGVFAQENLISLFCG